MKLSLRELVLIVAVIGEGIVIYIQQRQLDSARLNEIPATIRVREDSYVHPNGPASDRTNSDGSRSGSNPPASP